jgi:hypothetical protein
LAAASQNQYPRKGGNMLWKYLKLQKMLDALFDDGWGCLGLPEVSYSDDLIHHEPT